MTTEYVLFLGAGATASEKAPIQSEIFETYFNSKKFEKYELKRFQSVDKFFNIIFGIERENSNQKHINFPAYEEVLGLVEMAIMKEEKFNFSNKDINLNQIHSDLILLIANVLRQTLQKSREELEETQEKPERHHDKLIKQFADPKRDWLSKTTIISLNYDLLIDQAIEPHKDYSLEYGVKFTNYSPQGSKNVYLYKLHGSLGWLYCPVCNVLRYHKSKVADLVDYTDNLKDCSEFDCNGRMIPIIIPPSYFKGISNYYIRQIWQETWRRLTLTRPYIKKAAF